MLSFLSFTMQHLSFLKGTRSNKIYVFANNNPPQYTKSGIESWIHKWKKNKWKTSVGANVRNKDLWLAIDSTKYALEEIGINVGLVWVRGHVGNPGNEAADRLAVEGCNREEG